MTSDTKLSTNFKEQRIIIVTADEDLINQIEKNNNSSLLTQIVLQSKTIDKNQNCDQQMNTKQFSTKNQNVSSHQNKVESRNKILPGTLTCVVCQSPANGYNFGAIACESCKTFFRRNAFKNSVSLIKIRN